MIERLSKGDGLRWLLPWAIDRLARRARGERPGRHLVVAICDHFEPLHGGVPLATGLERVRTWRERYPELASAFLDDEGRPPRHTFFYPGEQYHPKLLEPLAELCERGLGEVEVHLHHDGDTRASLRGSLGRALRDLDAHGLLARGDGAPRWAFVHGNWALANGRPDRRWCGVDDELDLLWEMGCYADFTFPSAPDVCQPPRANAIWYPRGDVRKRRAYDRAFVPRAGRGRRERVLLVTGPLALAARKDRLAPRIEASALTATDPPTPSRLATWIDAHVHVPGRPEWVFVKLHTHGAPEAQAASLLGAPQRAFHDELRRLRSLGWFVHYVTAREMFNIASAAIDGRAGWPGSYRDYLVAPPLRARTAERPHARRAVP